MPIAIRVPAIGDVIKADAILKTLDPITAFDPIDTIPTAAIPKTTP